MKLASYNSPSVFGTFPVIQQYPQSTLFQQQSTYNQIYPDPNIDVNQYQPLENPPQYNQVISQKAIIDANADKK
jgi:hypothetical protein